LLFAADASAAASRHAAAMPLSAFYFCHWFSHISLIFFADFLFIIILPLMSIFIIDTAISDTYSHCIEPLSMLIEQQLSTE
jgi:hypothetical protein